VHPELQHGGGMGRAGLAAPISSRNSGLSLWFMLEIVNNVQSIVGWRAAPDKGYCLSFNAGLCFF
jgi:hypothetical protein